MGLVASFPLCSEKGLRRVPKFGLKMLNEWTFKKGEICRQKKEVKNEMKRMVEC